MDPAPVRDGLFDYTGSEIKSKSWLQWLSFLVNTTPSISTGSAAPTTAPKKTGDIYCDTTSAKVYIAAGNSASTDWKLLN